jgi:hypothetical protein
MRAFVVSFIRQGEYRLRQSQILFSSTQCHDQFLRIDTVKL